MSELVESVKDVFKGGGNKKKKIIIFGVIGAAVVGLALYARSKGGASGSGDSAGIGDDTSGSGATPQEADLSGLIDGFGSEIDRLDARIANLGMTGQGYTTLDGSGGVSIPNTDNMAAYSPTPEEITVSTYSPTEAAGELAQDETRAAAEMGYNSILPVINRVTPAAAPVAVKSPLAVAVAPAPAAVKLVIAPKPVVTTKLPVSPELAAGMANDPYLAARINAAKPMTPTPVKTAVKTVSEGMRSFLGGNMAPAPKAAAPVQPVAAAKPNTGGGGGAISLNIVRTPAAAPKSMPYSPLNPAPTKSVKLVTGKTVTVPANPSRIGG
jgi:hypothetical protein